MNQETLQKANDLKGRIENIELSIQNWEIRKDNTNYIMTYNNKNIQIGREIRPLSEPRYAPLWAGYCAMVISTMKEELAELEKQFEAL